jgi:Flp pilus assembly protein TadG
MSRVLRIGRAPRPGSPSRATRGQALVEFALVVPIFLVMLFAIVDIGRVVWANDSLANAAREAARYAIVHGGSENNACPVGPNAFATIPAPSATCPNPSPSKESVRGAAIAHAVAGGSAVVVEVCYGTGCAGNADAAKATNARGTPVTVTVRSRVDLVSGGLLGFGSFDVSGQAPMLVNY